MHTLLHLLELLFLGVGQDGFYLLIAILHQRAHLLVALLRARRSIVMHGAHLFIPVLQDRQYLLLLIWRQVQLFRHAP